MYGGNIPKKSALSSPPDFLIVGPPGPRTPVAHSTRLSDSSPYS